MNTTAQLTLVAFLCLLGVGIVTLHFEHGRQMTIALWTVLLLGWVAAILLVGARLDRIQEKKEAKAQLRSDKTDTGNTTAANARKATDIVNHIRGQGEEESPTLYGELPQEFKDVLQEQAARYMDGTNDPKTAERELIEISVFAGHVVEDLKTAPGNGAWCLASINGVFYWVPVSV